MKARGSFRLIALADLERMLIEVQMRVQMKVQLNVALGHLYA